MRVLVTGGAGYVGSTSAQRLLEAGHEVVVLDSLATGHRAAVPPEARLVVGRLGEQDLVERVLRDEAIDAVLHCAARALVGESVADPALYFRDNVAGGLALLEAMRAAGVRRIVFSSTAAVYGNPISTPIDEDHPTKPINPYGDTKRAFETALESYSRAYDWATVALRYFNVAGATAERGEVHDPETHLIPNLLTAVLGGAQLTVHGSDYPTADGTCVRDYIHVDDLASAHIAALELTGHQRSGHLVCNLGTGSGYSVLEVIRTAESVLGRPVPHAIGSRRPGDPPVLVASNARAAEVLGWRPRADSLAQMIESAWRWRMAHPNGYRDREP